MKKTSNPNMLKINDIPSPHFDERAEGSVIDTIIIHSMHNPLVPDPFSPQACKDILDQYEVSAHFLIDRKGHIWRLVQEEKRAWHAGVSKMPRAEDGREAVNHFSIGIELIATEESGYTKPQLTTLKRLTLSLMKRFPVQNIYGHSDIAPERKTDPWGFDWPKFMGEIRSASKKSELYSPLD